MFELQKVRIITLRTIKASRRYSKDLKTMFELHKFELDRVCCICNVSLVLLSCALNFFQEIGLNYFSLSVNATWDCSKYDGVRS